MGQVSRYNPGWDDACPQRRFEPCSPHQLKRSNMAKELPAPPNKSDITLPLFAGGDPGKSGAVAIIDKTSKHVYTIRMDWTLDDMAMAFLKFRKHIAFALIEEVNAGTYSKEPERKQGVTSAFTFGKFYGYMQGMFAVAGVRREFVRPAKWQLAMGCRTKGDKNVSKAAAQQLFPKIANKITHRNADALLLAELARRTAMDRGWADA